MQKKLKDHAQGRQRATRAIWADGRGAAAKHVRPKPDRHDDNHNELRADALQQAENEPQSDAALSSARGELGAVSARAR